MADLAVRDAPDGGAGRGEEEAAGAPSRAGRPSPPPCRFCGRPLERTFVDLGLSPLANSYVHPEALDRPETFHPLHAFVCDACFLVQLPPAASPEAIFSDYAYFSSYSESWVEHARRFAAEAIERFGLGVRSRVVEIASNDGYLLRWFREAGVEVLGVEPAANVARAAEELGIPTRVDFFGEALALELAAEGKRADLLVGNNVLAHVPELNDFVAGVERLLAPGGTAVFEFPHLLRLVEENQFDTIYHEHFSYFSLAAVRRVFAAQGLTVVDVEELATHGGSLRLSVAHSEEVLTAGGREVSERVGELLEHEETAGLGRPATYERFGRAVEATKNGLLRFLLDAREEGRTVVGYGAPAKGNTLLNYCGVKPDLLPWTVDRSPHKQGLYLPGTRIPIHPPERIFEAKPDHVLILPWNLEAEIRRQMAEVTSWGGRFVVAIPEVRVL